MKPTYDCYPEYEKCLQKLVWKWVDRSRFDFAELLSEANMGFLNAVDTFDPDKACFHTHLYTTVNGRLKNYCYKQKDRGCELSECLPADIANPEQEYSFKTMLDGLGKEAKEMVDVALNCPAEMLDLIKGMTSHKQQNVCLRKCHLTKFFRAKGWTYPKIWKTFNEIKSTLN